MHSGSHRVHSIHKDSIVHLIVGPVVNVVINQAHVETKETTDMSAESMVKEEPKPGDEQSLTFKVESHSGDIINKGVSKINCNLVLVDCGATAPIINDRSIFTDFYYTFDSKKPVIE